VAERYWLETLGCPKNQVDSDKLAGTLGAEGFVPADSPAEADVVVVNTCAFIEAARQESIDTILELSASRHEGARLVVTGCLAERYPSELASALPEVDLVAGFGVPVTLRPRSVDGAADDARSREPPPAFDLLNLPRPATSSTPPVCCSRKRCCVRPTAILSSSSRSSGICASRARSCRGRMAAGRSRGVPLL